MIDVGGTPLFIFGESCPVFQIGLEELLEAGRGSIFHRMWKSGKAYSIRKISWESGTRLGQEGCG